MGDCRLHGLRAECSRSMKSHSMRKVLAERPNSSRARCPCRRMHGTRTAYAAYAESAGRTGRNEAGRLRRFSKAEVCGRGRNRPYRRCRRHGCGCSRSCATLRQHRRKRPSDSCSRRDSRRGGTHGLRPYAHSTGSCGGMRSRTSAHPARSRRQRRRKQAAKATI